MKTASQSRVLFIVAHPFLRESRSNRAVVEAVSDLPGLTLHPLYDLYPYFHIDARHEMEILLAHDMIVVQHPFYWYSMPALMRHWVGEVFQPGWAYGAGGDKLKGKEFLVSLTIGGAAETYSKDSYNRYPMETYLAPWNQTAHLCQMNWHKPAILYNSIAASEQDLRQHGLDVRARISACLKGGS
jgi:putative NADPH-quinone reductase